jgi:hypothetical protein
MIDGIHFRYRVILLVLGIDAQRMRLWVIDGGKALRKAIVRTFGTKALLQRCQALQAIPARVANPEMCGTASAQCLRCLVMAGSITKRTTHT